MSSEFSESTKKNFNAEIATLRLSLVIELERELRNATSIEALRFVLVNRLRELLPYHQAVLLRYKAGSRYQVETISNIAVIQRDAPYVAWSEAVASYLHKKDDPKKVSSVDLEALPSHLSEQVKELAASHLLWCPFLDSDQRIIGAVLLARVSPTRDSELILLAPLLECMSHAWGLFIGKRRMPLIFSRRGFWGLVVLFLILGGFFIPVRQSSLAPSEVVAFQPEVVSAPLQGVIKQILVTPNDTLSVNQALFEYEDTVFRNGLEVARREVDLARVELETATLGAFRDSDRNAQKAIRAAQLEKKRAEFIFAQEQFDKVKVVSQLSGLAIFNSVDDWTGRPVRVGERVMLIADPQRIAIDALLGVKDSLNMQQGSRVQIFLDNSPLQPLEGTVLRTSYSAEQTPEAIMAFRVKILLNEGERIPRIGARGVSKIYGESVSLFFFLFRRPLTVLRQKIGF